MGTLFVFQPAAQTPGQPIIYTTPQAAPIMMVPAGMPVYYPPQGKFER